jgi:hypothetical protein
MVVQNRALNRRDQGSLRRTRRNAFLNQPAVKIRECDPKYIFRKYGVLSSGVGLHLSRPAVIL